MREIKLRAWQRNLKEMHVVLGIDWDIGLIKTEAGKKWWNLGAYDLMQDTGLKDKNGKEIYEFDQLRGDWDVVNDIYLGTVEFYGGAFRIKETGLPLAWADKDKDCEVVGNKFEGLQNPSKGDIM